MEEMWGAGFAGNSPPISLLILFFNPRIISKATIPIGSERERRWFVLERPRCDTNGGRETEMTVTSKRETRWFVFQDRDATQTGRHREAIDTSVKESGV